MFLENAQIDPRQDANGDDGGGLRRRRDHPEDPSQHPEDQKQKQLEGREYRQHADGDCRTTEGPVGEVGGKEDDERIDAQPGLGGSEVVKD